MKISVPNFTHMAGMCSKINLYCMLLLVLALLGLARRNTCLQHENNKFREYERNLSKKLN